MPFVHGTVRVSVRLLSVVAAAQVVRAYLAWVSRTRRREVDEVREEVRALRDAVDELLNRFPLYPVRERGAE